MTHRMTVRVYYEDTDLAGVVYYANYLKFMERGRTEALREAGVDQSRLKVGRGLVFVVADLALRYRRPARFDDLLTVETRLARIGGASLDMAQRVARAGETCVEGSVRCALMDAAGRPARFPDDLRAALVTLLD